MAKGEFLSAVRAFVAQHPEDLPEVLKAAAAGAQDALDDAREKAGKASFAIISALALTSKKPLGSDLRQTMERHVVAAINPSNASEVERDFLSSIGRTA